MVSARKAKGLTQEELADRTKIDQSTISRIERGTVVPTGEYLARLCEELGLGPRELLDESSEDPPDEPAHSDSHPAGAH